MNKNKKHSFLKILLGVIIVAAVILIGLILWERSAENNAYYYPPYDKSDIHMILDKDEISQDDFKQLTLQTGLSYSVLESLIISDQKNVIYEIQDAFFTAPKILCKKNSPISWEEKIEYPDFDSYNMSASNNIAASSNIEDADAPDKGSGSAENGTVSRHRLIGYEEGDILITTNSHTFGWRNGHAAIVVDAEEGLTIEAIVLGTPSDVEHIEKWESYPNVLVLRLKEASKEERKAIADYALSIFNNMPYGFYSDLFENTILDDGGKDTHCAHLIWKSFLNFGYNLDSNKGTLVTPSDIAKSPLLEVVQSYGTDLSKLAN